MPAFNIDDLQAMARRRLPGVVWRYFEGGAEDELTLRANRAAFDALHFAPRILVDVSRRSQRTAVFGTPFDCPFGISPMSPLGLCRFEADIAMARAAREANVPFVLSSHAFARVGRVAAEAGGAPWFQVYPPTDRGRAKAELDAARQAGCEVLVVTADVAVNGNREYNQRNGFTVPLRLDWRTVAQGLMHPTWFVNVYLRSILRSRPSTARARRDFHDWDDLSWLRASWPGKLVVKGILSAEDARLAVQHGSDGILISNHGGRQLDGAPAPLDVLPQIAAAVGGGVALFVDGGIRRGADIVKALALGAHMAFIGRAALYGVAAGGQAGARRALQILKAEVDRVLALLGCNSLDELGPHSVARGRTPPADARPLGGRPTIVRIGADR
jgi:L-lactate dehydrogenase (cytochrome)